MLPPLMSPHTIVSFIRNHACFIDIPTSLLTFIACCTEHLQLRTEQYGPHLPPPNPYPRHQCSLSPPSTCWSMPHSSHGNRRHCLPPIQCCPFHQLAGQCPTLHRWCHLPPIQCHLFHLHHNVLCLYLLNYWPNTGAGNANACVSHIQPGPPYKAIYYISSITNKRNA